MDRENLPLEPSPEDALRNELLVALRKVQDQVARGTHDKAVMESSVVLLREAAAHLRVSPSVDEPGEPSGAQWSGPHRDFNPLVPVFQVERSAKDHLVARITFSTFFRGGGGAVHGGAIPLVFDHVLGRLTNGDEGARARTAYLHVNFRRVTPIDRELQLDASLDRQEGRKVFATARLLDGDHLLADAEALYIVLRPEQP